MPNTANRKVYLDMISDCGKRTHKTNIWERDFLKSIEYELDQNLSISKKQIECLEKIWKKAVGSMGMSK